METVSARGPVGLNTAAIPSALPLAQLPGLHAAALDSQA